MATINIRIDDKTKSDAELILKELGLSASSAITMFYKQIIRNRALPFIPSLGRELDYNMLNDETKAAVDESRRMSNISKVKGYRDAYSMVEDILNEDD